MNTISDFTCNHDQETFVIEITGRLDFSANSSLYRLIGTVPEIEEITVNLKNCEDIDSSGLGMLLLLRDRLKGDKRVTIEDANDMVAEKLLVTNFHKIFKVA